MKRSRAGGAGTPNPTFSEEGRGRTAGNPHSFRSCPLTRDTGEKKKKKKRDRGLEKI